MTDDAVEIRAESIEEAGLDDIFVAGHPVGILISKQQEKIKALEERVADVEVDAQQAQQTATNALGVARATDRGVRADGSPSKVDIARMTARNELIKRALIDRSSSAGGGITVGEVQQMCRPEHEMAYQTVKDAFGDLVEKWDGMVTGTNEAGNRAVMVDTKRVTKELVGVVEEDLGRDDLTKRLISRRGGEGGR